MTIENFGNKLYSGTKSDRKSDSLGSSADGTNTAITLTGGKFTKTTTDAYDLTKMYEKSEIAVTSNPSASGYRNGMTMSADGTKMYIVGDESTPWANEAVYQWNLSTAWDITTAVFSQSKDIGTDVGIPQGISFSADGTKMFVGGSESNIIKRWSLTSAWDISTAGSVDSGQSLDVSSWAYVYGILINSDGTNLYVCTGYSAGSTQAILRKYTLSTAYDLTSASATQTTSGVSGVEWKALAFNNDGTKLFIVEKSPNDKVEEYSLTTAYDLTTMGSADSSISFGTTDPTGIFFGNSGKDMFVCEDTGDRVVEYSTAVVPAYSFNGTSSHVTVGSTSDWNFVHDGSGATVSAWVYRNGSQTGNGGIFVTEGGQSTTTGFGLGIRSGGNAYARTINTSNSWQVCEDTSSSVSTGVWHHILATIDSTSIKLYVDGILNSSHTISGTLKSGNSSYRAVGRAYSGSAWSYLNGKLDDMGIWKRVLTATEISDLVNISTNSLWSPNASITSGTSTGASDGNIVTMGAISAWGNKIRGKDITNSSEQVIEFSVSNTNINSFIGIANGTDAITNGFYLTSGGDIFWKDGSGEADTNSNRASGDTYKLVWATNGNVDLYLKPSGGSYGSSLKSWTSVSGTKQAYIESYASAVITFLPSAPINGALVSSLSNKSNLKSYYSMDSATLEALKNTPDYTFNFSSDTDWTQTTAGTSNTVYIDTSAGNLRHNTTTNTSAMKKVYYDLTDYTSGSAVNDSKWTMRFKWVVTSQNAPSSWLMALSGNTTDPDSSGFNGIGIHLNDSTGSYGYHITTCDGSTKTYSSNVTTPSNSQTLYVELARTSATKAKLTMWSDSYGGTEVGTSQELTIPSGVTALKYLQSGSGQGGNSSRTMNATLDDLEIFDDSIQLDGLKNDFSSTSALDGVTGVRTNSIFQQTDVPEYYWYNGTSWLRDGSPPLGNNLHAWYDASDSSSVTKDSSNLVSQLNDKSGNGYNLTASGTGTGGQPLWVSGGKNDLDIVDFGSSKQMKAQWTAKSQPVTYVAFMYSPASDGSQDNFWDNYDNTNSSMGFANVDTSNNLSAYAPTNLGSISSTNYAEKWGLFTVIYNTTSSEILINGDQKASGDIGTNSSYGLTLSCHRTSATYGQIKLAEMLIYDKVLSSDELTTINNYFVNKWGAVLE